MPKMLHYFGKSWKNCRSVEGLVGGSAASGGWGLYSQSPKLLLPLNY